MKENEKCWLVYFEPAPIYAESKEEAIKKVNEYNSKIDGWLDISDISEMKI